MIELRWVVTPADPKTFTDEKRVLQYRFRFPKETDRIDAYPPDVWEWSEWQDVPVVPASNTVPRQGGKVEGN